MNETLTIDQALDDFNENFLITNPNTKKAYGFSLRIFKRYLQETLDIDLPLLSLDVKTCADCSSWLEKTSTSLDTKPYSLKTKKICVVVMRRFLNYYRVLGLISFSAEKEKEVERAGKVVSKEAKHSEAHIASLVDIDFGQRMIAASEKFCNELLETSNTCPQSKQRLFRLNGLRARALVSVLWSTGLRISDVLNLKRSDFIEAKGSGGYLKVTMIKTKNSAHVLFSKNTLTGIEDYLLERNDYSPWIFIQHGRSGKRNRKAVENFYLHDYGKHKGYGMRLGDDSARTIIKTIAGFAGYEFPKKRVGLDQKTIPYRKGETNQFVSPHAFRHWLAASLKRMDLPIDDIQNVLGHSTPETTKKIYAPEANTEKIKSYLSKLHSEEEDE